MLHLRPFTTAALLFTALTPAAWGQLTAEPPEARTELLVEFHIENGNEVRMMSVVDEGELMVGEITNAGSREVFFLQPEMNPVDVFRLLAPENSPVPRAIAQLDRYNVFAGREIVETLPEPIEVPLSRLGLTTLPASTKSGAGSCEPNAPGGVFFENNHCDTLGGPGYGSSESECHKDAENLIDIDTNSKRRATYTRMAACGSDMSRFRHLYGTVSGWSTQVNVYIDPQKVVSWWSYKDGVKRHRRVIFQEKDSPSGAWVRGWVKFHSEAAEGW